MSACESEILCTPDGVKELEFVVNLLEEIKFSVQKYLPVSVINDNEGCIKSIEIRGNFKSNRHYRIRVNRLRRAVNEQMCKFVHCSGKRMVSDVLTKQIPFHTMQELLEIVGVELLRV